MIPKGVWEIVSLLKNNNSLLKRSYIYLAISAFLVIFNIIYGVFSHDVTSNYMTYAFLIPLIGGTVPSLILIFLPKPSFIVKNIWRMGIASTIIGFLLRGVFEIYGTFVSIVNIYIYLGLSMLFLSLCLYGFMSILSNKKNNI